MGRGTPSAFQQSDISVSRTDILPYPEIVRIFKADLERLLPDGTERRVEATASLTVDNLFVACKDAKHKGFSIEVVADPREPDAEFEANPAHALIKVRDLETRSIPRKLTRGLANEILKVCVIRPLD